MITEDDVRRIAVALPGAYEQVSHEGAPSWRTRPRMFCWLRPEPYALVVWVESEPAKQALIASEPDVYFTTPHYDGYPIMLVNPASADPAGAADLITESWRLRAPASLRKQLPEEA